MRFTSTTREPLNNTQILHMAPSVFAEQAATTTSDRYTFLPTIDLVKAMRGEGWMPVFARQSRTRIEEKRGFTRHEVRFRNMEIAPVVGDTFPEISLINSHDAGSSYQLDAGLFRLACANGMIVPNGSSLAGYRIHHKGAIIDEVLNATFQIAQDVPQVIEMVKEMDGVRMTPYQQKIFAEAALTLRWDEDDKPAPITPQQLLRARRLDDTDPTLWKTFNVLQENLLKGGQRGISVNEVGKQRRIKTRQVQSITEDVRLNKALWILGQKMLELAA
jgi:hypothetical protein